MRPPSGSVRWDRALAAWCGGVSAFQAGLAAGLPWGAASWGGRHEGVLPARLRVASAVACPAVALVGATAVGRIGGPVARRRVLVGTVAYSLVGIVANAASPSPIERAIGVPMSVGGATLAALAYRHLGQTA